MRRDYDWLNEDSRVFLKRGYLQPDTEPEQRYREIAEYAENLLGVEGFADKFESYVKRGWYSLSSPIISNFGAGRGLPISCNGSYIADRMDSILQKTAEIGMMTKHGAGTSAYFGAIRERGQPISVGGVSAGPVHFAQMPDAVTNVVSQSSVRRGSCAVYLPVTHPDILEFLQIRDEGNPIQHLSIGVCIPDEWMRKMIDGDRAARKVWTKIIQKRVETGYPYLFFSDTANNNAPQVYRDLGMTIFASNLCSEIMLPSSEDESFVCDLSSMNLLYWEEWKETDAVLTLTYFLDAVMTDYINKTHGIPFMEAAHRFAVRHRALGIGVLGWHSYLQSKLIAFESMEAKYLNVEIWKHIREQSHAASREMALRYGCPELLAGYGMRNTTTMAVAPTTSSSFILGQVSPSIEPLNSNYFVKDLAKGKFAYKNPALRTVLKAHGRDTTEVWKNILLAGGSVQHLEFLTDHERLVFKTFGEISQKEIVIQAAARQKYIDQGQSLNLMIHPSTPPRQVSDLLIWGWEQGVKSFYYQRGTNPAQELGRSILSCASCES
jgi:ribonucleoside-diphosphate reductase alpha chain